MSPPLSGWTPPLAPCPRPSHVPDPLRVNPTSRPMSPTLMSPTLMSPTLSCPLPSQGEPHLSPHVPDPLRVNPTSRPMSPTLSCPRPSQGEPHLSPHVPDPHVPDPHVPDPLRVSTGPLMEGERLLPTLNAEKVQLHSSVSFKLNISFLFQLSNLFWNKTFQWFTSQHTAEDRWAPATENPLTLSTDSHVHTPLK